MLANDVKGVTSYHGVARFYFRYLLKQIIKVGELNKPNIAVLDFGCGKGELKRLLNLGNVVGYDIIPRLSDVQDWRDVDFDVLVANEVFYSLEGHELERLLDELKRKNSNLKLVVGISRQGILNNIGKILLGRSDAHSATKIGPKKELQILQNYCDVRRRKNVFFLADILVFTFKSE